MRQCEDGFATQALALIVAGKPLTPFYGAPVASSVDITPVEDRNFANRRFVEHLGDDAAILEMRTGIFITLSCQGHLPPPSLDPMLALQGYQLEDAEGLF